MYGIGYVWAFNLVQKYLTFGWIIGIHSTVLGYPNLISRISIYAELNTRSRPISFRFCSMEYEPRPENTTHSAVFDVTPLFRIYRCLFDVYSNETKMNCQTDKQSRIFNKQHLWRQFAWDIPIKLHSLSIRYIIMTIYNLYIFDKYGIMLYYGDWNRTKQSGITKEEVNSFS